MKRKDMLGLDGVSREEITSILDTAHASGRSVKQQKDLAFTGKIYCDPVL